MGGLIAGLQELWRGKDSFIRSIEDLGVWAVNRVQLIMFNINNLLVILKALKGDIKASISVAKDEEIQVTNIKKRYQSAEAGSNKAKRQAE